MPLKVALLDMAGTTVADDIDGNPFVLAAFERVFGSARIPVKMEELNPMRGLDKRHVFGSILAKHGRTDETETLLSQFEIVCLDLMPAVRPMPGAIETCAWLKEKGLYVALGSGLPHTIAMSMAQATGLHVEGLVDVVTSGQHAGGGRPGPEMIHDVLEHAGLPREGFDYSQLLKVGDTPADIQEGKGVGALTIAVTSGTHDEERLHEEGPDAVLPSIADLPAYLSGRRAAG